MLIYIALLGLLALGLIGLALTWVRKSQEAQREAFEALAARRGWSLRFTKQALGRPALLRLSSRGGAQWVAQSLGSTGQGGLAHRPHMAEYTGEEPRWSDGYIFIGPAAPQSEQAPMNPAQVKDWTRRHIIGDGMGADLSGLEPVPAPENLSVLATTNPGLRIDLGDLSKLWTAWQPFVPTAQDHPIIMLGPDGMRVRLWNGVKTADQMEQLIDFALTVTRTIGNR